MVNNNCLRYCVRNVLTLISLSKKTLKYIIFMTLEMDGRLVINDYYSFIYYADIKYIVNSKL